jgi:hypothetical protein
MRSPQDAVVFASVLSHLETATGEKCFLNRNAGDFADPDVVAILSRNQCKLLLSFQHGLEYIQSRLRGG